MAGMCALLARPLQGQEPVKGVVIERHDVFTGDVARTFYGKIANAIHIVTRDAAIRREVLVRPGQPYDSALAAESARNLRRLGVFRQVAVDTFRSDSGLMLRYITDDGWSTKAEFRFGSTGNQASWTIGAYEDNLLGTAGQVAFEHKKTPDRSSNTFLFQRSRLFANAVAVHGEYTDRTDGWRGLGSIGVPWLSVQSRGRAFLTGFMRDERVLRFVEGAPAPADSIRRVQTIVRGDFGWAPIADPRHFVRLGLIAQARRDDFGPWEGPDPIGKTVTGEFQFFIDASRARYQVMKGFRTFVHQEDVDLSASIRIGVAVAPQELGYAENGIGPVIGLHGGTALGQKGFVSGDFHYNAIYRSAGPDSGTVQAGTTIGWSDGRRHVLVAHAEAGWKENMAPGEEYDLGLGIGPRAYGDHAFTGDRELFATGEYRFALDPDLWGLVGIGIAAFADYGGAWYDGSPSRTGTDAGLGLRIGPSRATSLAVVRLDVAHRFTTDRQAAGWVLVIGKGLPFQDLGGP
jgi:hypothetical protein